MSDAKTLTIWILDSSLASSSQGLVRWFRPLRQLHQGFTSKLHPLHLRHEGLTSCLIIDVASLASPARADYYCEDKYLVVRQHLP